MTKFRLLHIILALFAGLAVNLAMREFTEEGFLGRILLTALAVFGTLFLTSKKRNTG
jgi:hypothetical protein